jgi:hypothetical protein
MQFSPASSLEVAGTVLMALRDGVGLSLFIVMIMFRLTTVTYIIQLLFQQNALVFLLLKAQDITICTFLSLYF